MDTKRRRIIWIGVAVLFILAVASGYWPDVVLMRELSAARSEGLLLPKTKKPATAKANANAWAAYDSAFRKNMNGMSRLVADPMKEARHPSPAVRQLLDAFAEASKLPMFERPAVLDEEDPRVARPMFPIEGNLQTVANAFVTSARSADDLETAARIANHLRNDDPGGTPSLVWIRIAAKLLDAADHDHLPAESRARLVAALGPRPDPKTLVKRHVAAVLEGVENEKKSPSMARREASYIGFWRGFLRTAPWEPRAFADAIAAAEPKIIAVEEGVNVEIDYSATMPAHPWKGWADSLANLNRRLDMEPKQ